MTTLPSKPPPFQFGLGSLFVAIAIVAFLVAAVVAAFQKMEMALLYDLVWHGRKAIEDAREWLAR